ncbi:hypothetical protein SPRG_09974 [Saprolegnia parasitica CBS 223.65]|uniref:P-type phospholipid transporter n=1 Tax=Saprolegnia parasitica (strain CBS 223.65) TaxID=695850 RepID=A0A067C9H8_SAPPC|nr:hypothetical protein SPRG_09974 [Saprolegnia parasitica CBS 223.65]KDO23166.1 hypothetical protein SPRG_09974 [Saprolegnia parasitica CBS 223.65]|eukprot:XP_012206118.1 hypothetical protein SPRG_09974 [Saprolegnia parasitica CBS 223.65]
MAATNQRLDRCLSLRTHSNAFTDNRVRTSKYTLASFVPLNLLEQFRRVANVYFLLISLLQLCTPYSPTNPFATLAPFLLVLLVTMVKEGVEDKARHDADALVNTSPTLRLGDDGHFAQVLWRDVAVGDILKVRANEVFPADLLLLASSHDDREAYIDTSNLDGESTAKVRLVPRIHISAFHDVLTYGNAVAADVRCQPPTPALSRFDGVLQLRAKDEAEDVPFTSHNVCLRATRLVNTAHVLGAVLATGSDTKLMQNKARSVPRKRSHLDVVANKCVLVVFLLLLLLNTISAIKGYFWQAQALPPYLHVDGPPSATTFLTLWVTYLILYNNLVPISLYISLEIAKWYQAKHMEHDVAMTCPRTGQGLVARTSNLNEDLGRVQYLFTDKTGTLTKNEMVLQKLSISGQLVDCHGGGKRSGAIDPNRLVELALLQRHQHGASIREFFRCLLLCHSARIGSDGDVSATSPDEVALLAAAADFDCAFDGISNNRIQIVLFGQQEAYTLLACNAFDSLRKCMSVLVQRESSDEYWLYCKGADNALLHPSNATRARQDVETHIRSFACLGLRTLVFGRQQLDAKAAKAWLDAYAAAQGALHDREHTLHVLATTIEASERMEILGGSGVEDKLQDGVHVATSLLTKAGIRVWMLTGDKDETAVALAHAAGLLSTKSLVLPLCDGADQIAVHRKQLKRDGLWHPGTVNPSLSVLLGGASLDQLLTVHCLQKPQGANQIAPFSPTAHASQLFELLSQCQTVVASRLSPIQKANLVRFVKAHSHDECITLAIGDGGNDVSMIQEAHVGVGIFGVEGLQAVRSADFGLAQFRFLTTLLLLHGRWNCRRVTLLILLTFYKNTLLVATFFLYSFLTGFSGQTPFDSYLLVGWNVLYTCLPLFVIGIFDKDLSGPTLLLHPRIYLDEPDGSRLSLKTLLLWMVSAVLEASANVVLISWSLGYGGASLALLGTVLYASSVLIVLLKAAACMQRLQRWRHWHVLSLLLSAASLVVFIAVYEELYAVVATASALRDFYHLFYRADTGLLLLALVLAPAGSLVLQAAWYSFQRLYWYSNRDLHSEVDAGLGVRATSRPRATVGCTSGEKNKSSSACTKHLSTDFKAWVDAFRSPDMTSDCDVLIAQLRGCRLQTQHAEVDEDTTATVDLDVTLHPFSLAFLGKRSAALEAEYASAFRSREVVRIRRVVALAAFLFLLNVLVQYFVVGATSLYVVSRVLLLLCALAYTRFASSRWFHAHYDLCVILPMAGTGLFISATIVDEGYVSSTLFPIALFAVFRVRFTYALSLALANYLVYVLFAMSLPSTSAAGLGYFTGYIGLLMAFAAHGSWRVQVAMRHDFLQHRSLALQEKRARAILEHMLPRHIMAKLQSGDPIISEADDDVTILFCDVVDFTQLMQRYSPAQVVSLLDHLYSLFDELCAKYGVQKMETVGKTYMACAGLQEASASFPVSPAIRAACMARDMQRLLSTCKTTSGHSIKLRIGLHSGRVLSGLVGRKKQQFSLFGDTVNTASRMQSTGTPGQIQLSSATQHKLRHDFAFSSPSRVLVKGKGEMETFLLGPATSDRARAWAERPGCVASRSHNGLRRPEPVVSSIEAGIYDEMAAELHPLWLYFYDHEMEATYAKATTSMREEATSRCLYALGVYLLFSIFRDASQGALVGVDGRLWLLVAPRMVVLGLLAVSLLFVPFMAQHGLVPTSCLCLLALSTLHVVEIAQRLATAKGFAWLALDVVFVMFVVSSGGAVRYASSIGFNALAWVSMVPITIAMGLLSENGYDALINPVVLVSFTAIANVVVCRGLDFFTRRKVWLETQTNIQTRTADRLLYQRLPEEVVTRMKQGELVCDEYRLVGILYSDIKGFTTLAARTAPEDVIQLLDSLFAAFDVLTEKHGVFKLQTIGDAYVIVSGLPFIDMSLTEESLPPSAHSTPHRRMSARMQAHRVAQQLASLRRSNVHLKKPCLHVHQHIRNLLHMAFDMHKEVAKIRDPVTNEPLQMRIGVHLGNLIGGVIGDTTLRYDMWGLDAMLANTLESNGVPGGVVVSDAVKRVVDEAGDDFTCAHYKTLDGGIDVYTVACEATTEGRVRRLSSASPKKGMLTSGVGSPSKLRKR